MQVKRGGLAIILEKRGTSSGIALRDLSCPPVRSVRHHTGELCAPEVYVSGLRLSRQSGLRVLWGPHTRSHPNYTWGTSGISNCGGQSLDFLLDTGTTYSVLTESPGPLSPLSASVMWLSVWAKCYYFSCLLSRNWDSVLFSQEFLIVQSLPHPFGKGYIKQGPCLCFHEYGALSFSPIN